MFSRQRPGPKDATTSTGIGRNRSPPVIIAPVPRRATNESILDSDSDNHDSRHPLPNTPLHSSTPGVLNPQLPLNGIPDTHRRNGPSSGGDIHTPHPGHSRTNSGSSATSNLSTSSRKAARFSPNLTVGSPGQMHNPPPPGSTPVRSAMRQTPSPTSTFPQYQFPPSTPSTGSVPDIHIVHPTPPSPTSQGYPAHQPHTEPGNAGGSSSDDSDGDHTPGQRAFRSPRSSNQGNGSPRVRGPSPREPLDDSGYFSPSSSVLAKSHGHVSATRSRRQSQGASNTISYQNQAASNTASQQNQTGGTTTTNQNRPASSSSQVNQNASQRRMSGTPFRTSWQAPRSPNTCSPVIPYPWPLGNAPQNPTNPTSSHDPVRPPYAIHSPTRSTRQPTNRDLPRINTLFDHPATGQSSARPRSSHVRSSQHTPYGATRITLTPANGGGSADVDSVVNNLLTVPATSVTWQTPRGVLTWTPHPGLPNSGPNLLGGGGGIGAGGRVGNADWWTGGYPMPGACPTWTPGPWPPTSPATSRRAPIQLAPWMIPNPCNAALPHLMWDISQSPTTAKRITGNHVIVSVGDRLDDIATHPAADRLVVACQVGVAQSLWGHIDVRASGPKGVTVWDVLNGIYEYFQKRVGRRELNRMKEMVGDEQLEEKMASAFYQRVLITPALPGYELKEGLKRVDCLGDACIFWGLYVSYNDDGTWQLNLGLVSRRRRHA